MSNPKLNIKEESSAKKTRSPPKKARVEQSVPRKKKLKTDADKAAERAQHLRFGKAELTPDELSRLSKAQKREMYAAHAARSVVHRGFDQHKDDNVGTQALSEGEKEFKMIAVAGGRSDNIEGEFPPCGVCRQVMAEFCSPEFVIILATGKDSYKKYFLSELLPQAFSPGYLK